MESPSRHPYLTRGIIAYIGNKRRLLSLIGEAVSQAADRPVERLGGLAFADLFSGSGVVSRYARFLGMRVTANDWEPYARVLARAWLEPRPGDLPRLFPEEGGMDAAFRALYGHPEPSENETYLSRYYAPASDNPRQADYRTERLFYTRQNALRLDAARNHIDASAPPHGLSDDDVQLRRCMLLGAVIYAAATHVNTSGVFKACHKGFGGHGGDALGRITAPVEFQPPEIIDAPAGRVFQSDAAELAAGGAVDDADVVYLDPPYNQHQYGSNYHLLNTLVRWDRIPEPLDLGADGRLLRKAGIRRDWTDTRSPYCSRTAAEGAFSGLLETLKAPMVLLSYSTDGIIPFQRLRTLCEDYGRVRLCANPYVTYRGGRQSVNRRDGNLEFVLIVEKGKANRSSDRREIERVLTARRLQLARNDLYRPDVLLAHGRAEESLWYPALPGTTIPVSTEYLARIHQLPSIEDLSDEDASALLGILDQARCRTREEELIVLEGIWRRHPGSCSRLLKDIPRILRKMAHRKYRDQFEARLASLRELGRLHPEDFIPIAGRIDAVEELAAVRFAG